MGRDWKSNQRTPNHELSERTQNTDPMNCPKCNEDIMSMSVHYCSAKPKDEGSGASTSSPSLDAMNPEQQRIAIAKACGWESRLTLVSGCSKPIPLWFGPEGGNRAHPPDFLNDLNAMHEAEQVLEKNQEQSYFELLHDIAGNLNFYRATAAQRAEAFLRTLQLWKP